VTASEDLTSTRDRLTDGLFAAVFGLEMLIKILAYGLLWEHPAATYLRDSWNVLDCVVTVLSIVSVGVPSLNVVRAFRAFRLVRHLSAGEIKVRYPLAVPGRIPSFVGRAVADCLLPSRWCLLASVVGVVRRLFCKHWRVWCH
jgi:hypothetical protein